MSDTPTLAHLLTQWSSGGPPARQFVYAHLRAHATEAAAVEAFFRDDLRSPFPWKRTIAAEAMIAVYRDEPAAAGALAWVLAQGEPATSADAVGVLEKLAPALAAPLLAGFAVRAPDAFAALAANVHRWAGAVLAQHPDHWATVFDLANAATESALLMGLADAAPGARVELAALVPRVKSRLFHDGPGYPAGAALWRLTWRVNRDWLASINPHSPRLENHSALLVLIIDVLGEHLGRRPDLAPLVRDLLIRLAGDAPEKFKPAMMRLARLGGRGWGVLLPLLGDPTAPAAARALVFNEAADRPAVAYLAAHSAHRLLRERADSPHPDVLGAAGGVLAALGAGAGSALPDLLDLLAEHPRAAASLTLAVLAVAPGHPSPRAAVARTLDRLRRSVVFDPEAFGRLARVFSWISTDSAPLLVEDTGLELATVEAVLKEAPWLDAPADVRLRHARLLADRLGSPRAEVRARALACLTHYADQLPNVWPALVAVLVGRDDATAALAFPLFEHLHPITATVENELRELLRERNPAFVARAVVALWHLGRVPAEASARCRVVFTDTTGAWNWTVPREVVAGVVQSQAPPDGFGTETERVIGSAHGFLFAEDAPEEAVISTHVRARWPPRVDWERLHGCVGSDPEGPVLFLALLCAFGGSGCGQKAWMIKHQRAVTGKGLGESKLIVERAIARLGPNAAPDERRTCVRNYFGIGITLPLLVTDMLSHRSSWYRWAALELIDAWDVPELARGLVGARTRDRSERVRRRALRMVNGQGAHDAGH